MSSPLALNETSQKRQVDTSKVFILYEQKQGKKKDKTVYIPGYIRLKVKNFTTMDLQNLNAQMNATLIFTVYYGDIDKLDPNIGDLLASSIVLLFGRDDAIKLDQSSQTLQTTVKHNESDKQIQFSVRKIFNLRIQSDVFWSPFQIINLILSITIQPVTNKQKKKQQKSQVGSKQQLTIKVNLMDYQNDYMKLSYTEQGTFGNYDLIQSRLKAIYSFDRVCKVEDFDQSHKKHYQTTIEKIDQKFNEQKQKQEKTTKKKQKKAPKADFFQYAHFIVPLYKFPSVAIATIFLPLWLLGFINLGIFFQDEQLSGRIGSIAALMIAFVSLIPVIRQQIPPNPKIVFIEILVYIETFTSLLALIHSLYVRSQTEYQIIWYQSGLFMVSAGVTLINVIIIIVMMLIHYFVWQPQYNAEASKGDKEQKFNRSAWKNQACDYYFNKYLQKYPFIKCQIRKPAHTQKIAKKQKNEKKKKTQIKQQQYQKIQNQK